MVNITWKRAFQTHPHVVNLTLIQLATAEIVSVLMFLYMGRNSVYELSGIWKKNKWDLALTGSFFAFGQLCTNASLAVMSISSTHIIKITEPIMALILGKSVLKDYIPKPAIFYTCLILAGVAIATVNDVSVSPPGILLAGLSNVGMQARNVNIKLMRGSTENELDNVTLFMLTNLFSLLNICFLVPFNLFSFEPDKIKSVDLEYSSVLSGICLACQHIMSIFVLQNVYISTHALLNVIKRLLIIVISAIFMKTALSIIQTLGIGMALMGFYLYTLAMSKPDIMKAHNMKFKVKVVFILVLCAGTFSSLHYGKVLHTDNTSHSVKLQDSSIISFASPITAIWSYSKDLDDSSLSLLSKLDRVYPHGQITVYCASSKCMNSINVRAVKKQQIRVLELTSQTPLQPWAKRHALMKIITGPAYESHLQKAIQLSILWKFGGIVLDLDLNVTQDVLFLSRVGQLENNTCIFTPPKVPLALCKLRKRHPFVNHLMNSFVSSFATKPDKPWPYIIDFNSILQSTISFFHNSKDLPKDKTSEYFDVVGMDRLSSKTSKFGMIDYATGNIGDEVQSIAAAHFLPHINVLVPRDQEVNVDDNTTVIMNAFWPENSWLVRSWSKVHPIQVSMHIAYFLSKSFPNKIERKKNAFLKHGVVGTRDTDTLKFLNKLGIQAKMTGCLTLFYQNPFSDMPRLNSIYLVDVGAGTQKLFPSHLLHNTTKVNHGVSRSSKKGIDRYAYAYKLIEKYARAKLVITTRIHCALPCVALGTPVIFLNLKTLYNANVKRQSPRVSGLTSLFHTVDAYNNTRDEMKLFLKDFNYQNPPPNPNKELADTFRKSAWSLLKVVNEIEDVHKMYDLRP